MGWFADAQRLPETTVLWIDFLGVKYHEELAQDTDQTEIQHVNRCMEGCEGMICVDAPDSTYDTWRLLELELAVRLGLDVYIGCATGLAACSRALLEGGWEFGTLPLRTGRKLQNVRFHDRICCSDPTYRQVITDYFEKLGGLMASKRMESRLERWGAGLILRNAAIRDQQEDIIDFCQKCSLLLTSETLKGPLGETPVHLAAAHGSEMALRALLRLNADPNAEDCIREQPLHYAALAGHASAARVLLEFGADSLAESALGETAWQVAKQNLGGFLGVWTTDLEMILRDSAPRVRPDPRPAARSPMDVEKIASSLTCASRTFGYADIGRCAARVASRCQEKVPCGSPPTGMRADLPIRGGEY